MNPSLSAAGKGSMLGGAYSILGQLAPNNKGVSSDFRAIENFSTAMRMVAVDQCMDGFKTKGKVCHRVFYWTVLTELRK